MVEQINHTVIHQNLNGKYRIVVERAASTKGILGYKIEANGDDLNTVIQDAGMLQERVQVLMETPEVVKEP